MLPDSPAAELPWEPQRLRVPREDGSLFARPSLAESLQLIEANRQALDESRIDLQGRTLQQLREWTRQQVLTAAQQYTAELTGSAPEPAGAGPLSVSGHQPALFHPGVWAKNFALGELANRSGGIGLNLVIDNDSFATTRVRVPAGDRHSIRFDTVPFDDDRTARPWEEGSLRNPELFASFADRLGTAMQPWGIDPLIRQSWPEAVRQAEATSRLRDGLTAARVSIERSWGLTNLELPLSRMCQLDPFLWFSAHLLVHLPRFRRLHNELLAQYRLVNGIRSQTHPVPELRQRGEWIEAPFWVWQAGDETRRHLFARQAGRELLLSDGEQELTRLPITPEGEACCAVEALRELEARGIRFRTRALTTTLFARLCLSDLFIHGIGGAKYDEMTDRLICRFYNLPAPGFLTLSATVLLPLAQSWPAAPDDIARLRRQLRDLDYNAERYLTPPQDSGTQRLIEEKATLIAEENARPTSGHSRSERRRMSRDNYRRYRRLQEINRRLSQEVDDQRRLLQSELEQTRHELAANALLNSREYSFALYPAEKLRPFMMTLQ